MRVEEFRYNNAIIRMSGEPNRHNLEDAGNKFLKKVVMFRRTKRKG